MSGPPSRALVFYGATGDLAFKKIFPALQRMVKTDQLDVPVIGVAREGWSLERLQARARESVERHGGGADPVAFPKLMRLLRYIEGDYAEPATFDALRRELGAPRATTTREPRPIPTPSCWATRCGAKPSASRGRTMWRRPGASSIRFSTAARPRSSTRPAPGGLPRRRP